MPNQWKYFRVRKSDKDSVEIDSLLTITHTEIKHCVWTFRTYVIKVFHSVLSLFRHNCKCKYFSWVWNNLSVTGLQSPEILSLELLVTIFVTSTNQVIESFYFVFFVDKIYFSSLTCGSLRSDIWIETDATHDFIFCIWLSLTWYLKALEHFLSSFLCP